MRQNRERATKPWRSAEILDDYFVLRQPCPRIRARWFSAPAILAADAQAQNEQDGDFDKLEDAMRMTMEEGAARFWTTVFGGITAVTLVCGGIYTLIEYRSNKQQAKLNLALQL